MKLEELAEKIGGKLSGEGNADVLDVTDVTHDSRQVHAGTLFAAIKGAAVDGHRFIDDVIRRGAVAIMSGSGPADAFSIPWIQVANVRASLARAASLVNGEPSRHLTLVGVTGTNGKTTTTYLCYAIAEAAGIKPAMLTTVEYRIGENSVEAIRTTPEASDTNRFLREALEAGCGYAAMEASSQAIDLHRCDDLYFRVAIFTNLTQDHLDYHHTMDAYFDAKKKLFDGRLGSIPETSVINFDDEWGRRLAKELAEAGQNVVTFSQDSGSEADLRAENVSVSLASGTAFDLVTSKGKRHITSPLVGKPHVYNMLSAAGAALAAGMQLESIAAAFAVCKGAPGRFERVPTAEGFAVVVDYAHTEDAIRNTLATARPLTDGRIITVFGCGGDRDKSKRAPMGSAAGELSDLVFITSDNPRTEDPLKIIAEIESGVSSTATPYQVVSDRRLAIRNAIREAGPGDVVIIAGKGHENYQIIGNEKFHFDDREVAAEALAERSA